VKQVRIAQPASEEFTEAVRWYEGKRTGLGGEFYEAVLHAVDGPHTHRQYLVNGFPYKLMYLERTDDLYIIAMAHVSRRPGYWKQRR
jgi:toxin ParE1/3/4